VQSTGTKKKILLNSHLATLSSWPVHVGELVWNTGCVMMHCQNVNVKIHYDGVRGQFHLAHKSAEDSFVAWGINFCPQPYTGANGERGELQLNTIWNFDIIGTIMWMPRAWSLALTIFMMMACDAPIMTVPSKSHCHNATHCAHYAACVERFPVTTPRKLDRCYSTTNIAAGNNCFHTHCRHDNVTQ
jgi:hypothetical protein